MARRTDKQEILSFCVNTFSWGDYIDRVWDHWFKSGRLLVAEDRNRKIAMSHSAICPSSKNMWLEGVRVNPNYRRSRIATQLLANMIQYGRRNGAVQASAIVELTNVASQRMMEKSGFAILSRWAYYSSEARPKSGRSAARLATMRELESIWEYLQHSKIYDLSAKLYMKSWRWYPLDKRALKSLIKEKQVIVAGRPV